MTRSTRGVSLVEVLVALLIIACLGVTIQSLMVSTISGIGIDRASEVKRNMVLDLLERFCHPYSDLEVLFPKNSPPVATREISIDDAIRIVQIPEKEAAVVKAILTADGIVAFSLTWTRGFTTGSGAAGKALRLDLLWCKPVQQNPAAGSMMNTFRIFYVRGR